MRKGLSWPSPSRAVPVIALIGLFWLLHAIGFGKISGAFRSLGYEGTLLLAACGVLETLFDGMALQQATLGHGRFWRTHIINQTGAFYNMIVPAEAGEFLKVSLLAPHAQGFAATAILVWNIAGRLVKSLLILTAASAAFLFGPFLESKAAIVLGLALFNIGVYAVLSSVVKFGGVGRALQVVSNLPFLRGRLERVIRHVRDAEKRTAGFRRDHAGRYAAALLNLLGARATGFLTLWTALRFLEMDFPFVFCLLIYAAVELAGYVLAVLPTRIGTAEGSGFLVFEFLGLDGGLGVALLLILRLKQLAVTGSFLALGEALHWIPSPKKPSKKLMAAKNP